MKSLALFLLLAAAALLRADPVEISNQDAQKLWVALNQIPEGFTVANAMIAADDATALLPKVQAYERAMSARMRALKVTQAMLDRHDDSPAALQYVAEAEDAGGRVVTVDLARFDLTPEEISKVRVSVLAVLRQYLKPLPPPPAKTK